MLKYRELHYSSTEAYPSVSIKQKNSKYARLMLDNMGGINSEMSAVSLYFYNNLIIHGSYVDIAFVFQKISVVEMHHLEIFGHLALSLGADPRLWTQMRNRMQYWSPGYNKYPTDLHGLMNHALEGELAAIAKYKQQLAFIDDECVVNNLKRIILDEELHVDIFKQIICIYQ